MEINNPSGGASLTVVGGATTVLNVKEIDFVGATVTDLGGGTARVTITGGVTSVSNSDGTLTISPTTGAVVASLNLAHANTWTGQQTFNTATAIFGVAPTFSTMTAGSVLFTGTAGALSQDNSNFFWDGTNHKLGLGTTTFGTNNRLVVNAYTTADSAATAIISSTAIGNKGLVIQNKASQTANAQEWQSSSSTPYVTVGPDVLSGSSARSNFLTITGTLPSIQALRSIGIGIDITGAGSAITAQKGMELFFNAGFTGTGNTLGLEIDNNNASTSNNLNIGASNSNPLGNSGFNAFCYGTTTGLNVGGLAEALGGGVNVGAYGKAVTAKNSATNIGVLGVALNTGTTPIQIGGYFGLLGANPTFVSAVVVANNGTTTSPIFLGQANGTTVSQFDVTGILMQGGSSRVSTQFDKTTDTTLAAITGLSATLVAGKAYAFKLVLHITADVAGGEKIDMGGGSATATAFISQVNIVANSTNVFAETSRQTSLTGASAGIAGDTSYYVEVEGLIRVNAAGTFIPRFAQKVSNGTSSILVGSTLIVQQII